MKLHARTALILPVLALAAGAAGQGAPSGSYYEELIRSMGIDQKIGQKAALDAKLTDQDGKSVTLGGLLKGRPLLILPTYYTGPTTCPMLTDNLLMTLARTHHQETLLLGRDLDVLILGLNPLEGPKDSSERKTTCIDQVMDDRRNTSKLPALMPEHWTVVTGSLDQIKKATDSLGFRYRVDAKKDKVDYPTGTVLLAADGKISGYTIGNEIPTRVLENETATAKEGGVSPKADQVQMFGCLSYNPQQSPYRGIVQNAIRVTGTLTVLILGFSIFAMSRKPKGSSADAGGTPKA